MNTTTAPTPTMNPTTATSAATTTNTTTVVAATAVVVVGPLRVCLFFYYFFLLLLFFRFVFFFCFFFVIVVVILFFRFAHVCDTRAIVQEHTSGRGKAAVATLVFAKEPLSWRCHSSFRNGGGGDTVGRPLTTTKGRHGGCTWL